MALPRFADGIDPSWLPVLESQTRELAEIDSALEREHESGNAVAPDSANILRVLRVPVDSIRVLIVGQDPYPTPGHAAGWAFSVDRAVRPLPRSLTNIFVELRDDLGVDPPNHGDLTSWVERGVALLNTTLTVRVGEAGSHRHLPWRAVTGAIVTTLASRELPLVTVLWGNDALWAKPLLGETAVVESAHPSPLSARRGFFGSRPFSRVNELLIRQGAEPIDWHL